MGQKVSPIGFRTGITRPWQSTWYAPKADYGSFLVEDQKIRRYVDVKYNRQMPKGAVAKIEVIRTRNEVKVTLHSARPGIVIGPRGDEVDKLRVEIEEMTGRKVSVNVVEIKEPDLNAMLVAEFVAEQLCKRASFRRTMKQQCEAAMNAGAKGVKIICGGRLGGAEMARKETQKLGSIPLHTLDADVDYARATANTTYGSVGVKVWIYKGKFGEEIEPRAGIRRRAPRRAPGRGRAGPAASGVKSPRAGANASATGGAKSPRARVNASAASGAKSPRAGANASAASGVKSPRAGANASAASDKSVAPGKGRAAGPSEENKEQKSENKQLKGQ